MDSSTDERGRHLAFCPYTGERNTWRDRVGLAADARIAMFPLDGDSHGGPDVIRLIKEVFLRRDFQLHIRDPTLTAGCTSSCTPAQVQNIVSVYVTVLEASRKEGYMFGRNIRPEIWCPIADLPKLLRAVKAIDGRYEENTKYGVFSVCAGVDPEKNPPHFGPEDGDEYNEHRASIAEYHRETELVQERLDMTCVQILGEPREEFATWVSSMKIWQADHTARFAAKTTAIEHCPGQTLRWCTYIAGDRFDTPYPDSEFIVVGPTNED